MTLPFLRSPVTLVGPSDTEVSTNEDIDNPVTYTPNDLVDKWGLYWVVSETGDESEAGSEGATGLSGAVQTSVTTGVRNADFAQGPTMPDEYIDDTNPLPYWSFVREAGGSINALWVEDADSPGGHAVLFQMGADAQHGDTAYLEQIIPVSGAEQMRAPRLQTLPVGTLQDWARWYRSYQALDAEGVAVGDEATSDYWAWTTSSTVTEDGEGAEQLVVGIPPEARYLRLRIGGVVNTVDYGNVTQASEVYLREVWCGPSDVTMVTLPLVRSAGLPGTGSLALYVGDVAYGRWVAPSIGWVAAVSVYIQNAHTNGTLEFSVWNETTGARVGPVAKINSFYPRSRANTRRYSATDNSFSAGDILRGVVSSTGGSAFTPTSNGAVFVATLATVPYTT